MSRLLSEQEPPQQSPHAPRRPDRRSGPEKKRRPYWLSELLDWVRTLAVALVLVVLVNLFLFNLSKVEGHSMEPTLEPHEWLFINKIGYRLGHPERGDVVVLKDPSTDAGRKEYLVKRIIGVPGDTIEIRGGQLYVNGVLEVEAYTDVQIEGEDYGPVDVEAGRYFIMGDNRHVGASKDSRLFGTVPVSLIKGQAEFVLWPVSKWDKL